MSSPIRPTITRPPSSTRACTTKRTATCSSSANRSSRGELEAYYRAMIRRLLLSGVTAALFCVSAPAANDPLETVEVTASREKIRKEISTFVHKVTRLEGEFVGRWGGFVCPVVAGVSD